MRAVTSGADLPGAYSGAGAATRAATGSPAAPTSTDNSRRSRNAAGGTIAWVLMFAIGMEQTVNAGVTIGDALLVLTGALWFLAYRQFSGAGLFLGWGALTAVAGLVLSEYDTGNRLIDYSARRDSTVLMLGLVAGVAGVLWARTMLSNSQIGISFGLGMLVSAGLHHSTWSTNPWKFAFAIPVSVLVLGMVARARRPIMGVPVLLLLAVVSLALDSRAYGVTLALAALLLLWRCLPKRESLRYGWLPNAVLIAGGAALVYFLATSLLVNGYLGKDVQARSVQQIQTSGSLILGGRPELAATIALMKHDISGFGVGIVPTPQDVLVAKTGLQSINYDPNNGYVERYMFAGHIELHSVLGDVWANWGIAGLVLLAGVALLMIRTLAESVSKRTGNALVVYLCLWTLWNLMFSPLTPALPILVLAIGLTLRRRDAAPARPDDPAAG